MVKAAAGILVGGKLMVSSRLFSPQLSFRAEVVGNIWERARSEALSDQVNLLSGFSLVVGASHWVCGHVCYRAQQTLRSRMFEDFLDLTSKRRFSQQLEGMSVP